MNIEVMERIKAIRKMLNEDNLTEDEIRAFCIQLETYLPKSTKTLYIDADSLIYYVAHNTDNTSTIKALEGSFVANDLVENIDDLVEAYFNRVEDVVKACRLESLKGNMIRFKDYKLVYTPSTNFRYDIFPDYKKSRKDLEQTKDLINLKNHVKQLGLIVFGVEADDVVAHYARRGHPVASGDKDVIYGVAGNNFFYHPSHFKVVKRTKEEADMFVLYQTLAGDSSDDIPGIKGIGLSIKNGVVDGKAIKLLSDNATFEDVVKVYEDKGLTREDAILTRRLIGLDQWRGLRRNKTILFKGVENV